MTECEQARQELALMYGIPLDALHVRAVPGSANGGIEVLSGSGVVLTVFAGLRGYEQASWLVAHCQK